MESLNLDLVTTVKQIVKIKNLFIFRNSLLRDAKQSSRIYFLRMTSTFVTLLP